LKIGNPQRFVGSLLAALLPSTVLQALIHDASYRDPNILLQGFAPRLNREPSLDSMPFDLPVSRQLDFHNLSGLFASTSLDHAVVSMTIRQCAYIFGLIREVKAKRIIEIGRY
jgi:hypothetical protein